MAPPLTSLQVAMARRADAALAVLTPEQQAIARRIFLHLVQFGEGRADTRRQQPVAALRVAGGDPQAFDHTLEHLTRHRLLTLSGEARREGRRVDIAHEALIGGWPTLQEWLTERRKAEQTRRRVVVVFDCCHSGGIGQPKDAVAPSIKTGFSEGYYDSLKEGRGRVIHPLLPDRPKRYLTPPFRQQTKRFGVIGWSPLLLCSRMPV